MLKIMIRATLIAAACGMSLAAFARADEAKRVDVPAGDLTFALEVLAKQSGVELIYQSEQLKGLKTGGVTGEMTPAEAVTKLLTGTPLQLGVDPTGAMLIVAPAKTKEKTAIDAATQGVGGQGANDVGIGVSEGNQGFWSRVRLARADTTSESDTSSQNREQTTIENLPRRSEIRTEFGEIIVTAQKREERLQDVPVPVSAVSAVALVDSNQVRLQDYFTRIPGLSLTPMALGGAPTVTIRGIATGGTANPSVGITVDDVPYGSSTSQGLGQGVPDIDPSELSRVEVLRGPQGTLYGASSMGGLIKFVTRDPHLDAFSGRLQGTLSSVADADALGYTLRGALNAPLGESFALRASAFSRLDPGYIDNPTTGQEDVNEVRVAGGQLAGVWRPANGFDLKLSALYQTTEGDGPSDEFPALGERQQGYIRGTGAFENTITAYSATATVNLGGDAELTSITGYNVNTRNYAFDFTHVYGGLTQGIVGFMGAASVQEYETDKFTQEIRVAATAGENVDWVVGLFYNYEESPQTTDILAINPANGSVAGSLVHFANDFSFEEYALFANLTVRLSDRFDVQFGGRESDNNQTNVTSVSGNPAIIPGGGPVLSEGESSDRSFSYLLTPRFRVSPDLMIYARFASGYRPGGPNINGAIFGAPASYEPDRTRSHEAGVKGDLFDGALSFGGSLYYIDWQDIQVGLAAPGIQYIDNAGSAESRGFEISFTARPVGGLTIAGWLDWNEAVIAEGFPVTSQTYAADGDRLPNNSEFSGAVSFDQEFNFSPSWIGSVGGTVAYVDERLGVFRGVAGGVPLPRQVLPAYTRVDLRARLDKGDWALTLFANNVTDERGMLQGGSGAFNPAAFQFIRPREIGVSLTRMF
jgi:outer membrane receptor protein involved in Fe transport